MDVLLYSHYIKVGLDYGSDGEIIFRFSKQQDCHQLLRSQLCLKGIEVSPHFERGVVSSSRIGGQQLLELHNVEGDIRPTYCCFPFGTPKSA